MGLLFYYRIIYLEGKYLKIGEFVETFEFKTKPDKHQLDCFKFGLLHNRFLLGDEQGLGKTKESIDLAVAKKILYGYKHCLIISCVASLRYNWVKEVQKHSFENCWVLGARIRRKVTLNGNKERLEDINALLTNESEFPYFIIVNIETLRNREIYAAITEAIDAGIINMIIADEVHKCKNPEAKQTISFMKLRAPSMILMSGTLVLNNPLDLFVPLYSIDVYPGNFWSFRNKYCILDKFKTAIIGYRNQPQLRQLVSSCLLRRKKEDVLDLPDKIYETELLEMSPKQLSIYKEVLRYTKEHLDKLMKAPNPLTELIRLRQATAHTGLLSSTVVASVKFERMKELVEEAVINDDKVIIFSNWVEVLKLAAEELREYNPAHYYGGIKDVNAQEERFHNDPRCKVILGTIDKMGTGLTLTEASTVIFLDDPWSMGIKDQAADRAHRRGQKKSVTVKTLVCMNTIDEVIEQIIAKKGAIADYLVDGKINNRAAVLNLIIKELNKN